MSEIRENKELLQNSFQKIADLLVPCLPEDWRSLVIGHFYTSRNPLSNQVFFLKADEDYFDLLKYAWDTENTELEDAILDATDVLNEIHEHCAGQKDDWTEMTIVLMSDGPFHSHFEYDEIPEFSGDFLLEWKSRYLMN
ncbi:MAG: DUF600 family protein [Oscillospiraceae bacterium]|nr:DUF600 family protein [Oscillospiraceae bacterium]